MSAQAPDPPGQAPPAEPAPPSAATTRPPLRQQVGDTLGSLRRIADLQVRIFLARVKSAALRILLFSMLALLSLLLTIASLVWLYAGAYRVLTDVLHIPTAWALLIFGGLHLLAAGILLAIGVAILKGPKVKPTVAETAP